MIQLLNQTWKGLLIIVNEKAFHLIYNITQSIIR